MTARFLASFLGQIAAYATGVTAAVLAFRKLNEQLHGIPTWGSAIIVFAPLILALTLHTIPTFIAEYRRKRLAEIVVPAKAGYFSLAPRLDEGTFDRADKKHLEILRWVERHPGRLLYLTGLSGSGKSSILTACVLPRLKSEQVRAITLRGYQNPVATIHEELCRPGVIWQIPPKEEIDTLSLLTRAAQETRPHRLLIVLDQFEEALILQDKNKIALLEGLLSSLRHNPVENLTFLLVIRSDYTGLIGNFAFPPLVQGDNWQEIPPFTESAAREFMMGSGLKVSEVLLRGILREAAEIDQTKGLIRPVTINLCGLVLGRFTSGMPRGFRPGSLIRGFLQESLTLRPIRDVTPRILPQLISHSLTKIPRQIDELAKNSGLDPAVVRGCVYVLAQSDRAIVRSIDSEQQTWEISHDFLVPLIDSIIARWFISLWRRSRPLLPWLAAAVLLLVFRLLSTHPPEPHVGYLSPNHADDVGSNGQRLGVLGPIPVSRGGSKASLIFADVLGSSGQAMSQNISKSGRIVFQMAGSTGDPREPGVPVTTQVVANGMEDDFRVSDKSLSPSFLFLMGDQVLYFGGSEYYYSEFYSPFVQYPAPILALAGNHEGSAINAFLDNFCATGFHLTDAARGINRTAQIQPGVYFTFQAPFVRIIALYSNAGETAGVISSEGGVAGQVGDQQLAFLESALNQIKTENFRGAVIVAVHHDPYSLDREESPNMQADLDAIFKKTGVWPHAIISGHSHTYSRYTRRVGGMEIPYVVSGNGGYSIHYGQHRKSDLATPSHLSVPNDDVTLEAYDWDRFGYLWVSVDESKLRIEYRPVSSELGSNQHLPPGDSVTVDLNTHHLVQ
jgi:hypothetical protein